MKRRSIFRRSISTKQSVSNGGADDGAGGGSGTGSGAERGGKADILGLRACVCVAELVAGRVCLATRAEPASKSWRDA